MMKSVLFIFISVFVFQVQAATKSFDIAAEIVVDGKVVSSPHIITTPNETASITSKNKDNSETMVEVVASDFSTDQVKDGILMKFTVSHVEDGKKKIVSKPQIITKNGEVAEIAVGEKGQQEALVMKLVAKRNK